MLENGDVVGVTGAARLLGLHEETVRRLARSGAVPAFKAGKKWRFNRRSLDFWAEAQGQPTVADDALSPHANGTDRATVLVVDDEEDIRALVERVLRREGFEVVCATDGEQALELLNDSPPDLMLTDLVMSGIDGATLLAEARTVHPHMPVVVITGYPNSQLLIRAMESGAITLLSKPLDLKQLARTAHAAVLGARVPLS